MTPNPTPLPANYVARAPAFMEMTTPSPKPEWDINQAQKNGAKIIQIARRLGVNEIDLIDATHEIQALPKIFPEKEPQSLITEIEALKKQPTKVSIPCPEGREGCAVYHYRKEISKVDMIYNQALSDVLAKLREKV